MDLLQRNLWKVCTDLPPPQHCTIGVSKSLVTLDDTTPSTGETEAQLGWVLGHTAVQRSIGTLHLWGSPISPAPSACCPGVTSLNPKAVELQSSLKIPGLLESPMGSGKADES